MKWVERRAASVRLSSSDLRKLWILQRQLWHELLSPYLTCKEKHTVSSIFNQSQIHSKDKTGRWRMGLQKFEIKWQFERIKSNRIGNEPIWNLNRKEFLWREKENAESDADEKQKKSLISCCRFGLVRGSAIACNFQCILKPIFFNKMLSKQPMIETEKPQTSNLCQRCRRIELSEREKDFPSRFSRDHQYAADARRPRNGRWNGTENN